MQFSTKTILFNYRPNKHLSSELTITNTTNQPLTFKFKASTGNRFIIKPTSGTLEPKDQATIQIIIHREIVEQCESEKLQIHFGRNGELTESENFKLGIGETQREDRINLTMMVEDKSSRIEQLKKDIDEFREMPLLKSSESKGASFGIKFLLVLLIGILIGYFSPVKLFKKKVKA